MDFSSNQLNEIFFVDGAERSLSSNHKDAFTSGAAHYLEVFNIDHEVDVYVSQRSVLHQFDSRTLAWHMPPSYREDNSVICVYVDPKASLKKMMVNLAHEMIHAWQVDRGDFVGATWKGQDLSHLPYQFQPWEIEAHGNEEDIAKSFFNDRKPSLAALEEMRSKTDQVFQEIIKQGAAAVSRKKWMRVAKVAGAIGLGAALGI